MKEELSKLLDTLNKQSICAPAICVNVWVSFEFAITFEAKTLCRWNNGTCLVTYDNSFNSIIINNNGNKWG